MPAADTATPLRAMRPSAYELRTLIFNAEMALCDLRGFAASAEYVDESKARERAADLSEQASKIQNLFGANNAPA